MTFLVNFIEKIIQMVVQLATDKIKLLQQRDLEYRKAQIEQLYGPHYGLLKTNGKLYDLWMDRKLDGVNLKVKRLFKENNDKANEIIIKNCHLIDESPMPELFIRFATSTKVWSMYCADSEDGALPEHIADHPDARWCREFEEYVFRMYETLSNELNGLYKKYQLK